MAELWYDDELIGEAHYISLAPKEGDLLQVEYDGEPRDFRVDVIRNYFPLERKAFTRIYLKAWGGWDLGLGIG